MVGRIYPECHSSSGSKEERSRRERGEQVAGSVQRGADKSSREQFNAERGDTRTALSGWFNR